MPISEPGARLCNDTIVLASASIIRARMLEAAGLSVAVDPAGVDEAEVRASLLAEGAQPRDIADVLAALKAERVSRRHSAKLVLGADQVLALGDRIFTKPETVSEACTQLAALSGRTHVLYTAAVLARDGSAVWRHVTSVRLHMRALSPQFINAYVAAEGERLLGFVGAYALEGLGAQLFTRVEGDYFSVLGLPLLPLLDALRAQRVIPT